MFRSGQSLSFSVGEAGDLFVSRKNSLMCKYEAGGERGPSFSLVNILPFSMYVCVCVCVCVCVEGVEIRVLRGYFACIL